MAQWQNKYWCENESDILIPMRAQWREQKWYQQQEKKLICTNDMIIWRWNFCMNYTCNRRAYSLLVYKEFAYTGNKWPQAAAKMRRKNIRCMCRYSREFVTFHANLHPCNICHFSYCIHLNPFLLLFHPFFFFFRPTLRRSFTFNQRFKIKQPFEADTYDLAFVDFPMVWFICVCVCLLRIGHEPSTSSSSFQCI